MWSVPLNAVPSLVHSFSVWQQCLHLGCHVLHCCGGGSINILVCIEVCGWVYVCVCGAWFELRLKFMNVCAYVHTYIHTYIHTYERTHLTRTASTTNRRCLSAFSLTRFCLFISQYYGRSYLCLLATQTITNYMQPPILNIYICMYVHINTYTIYFKMFCLLLFCVVWQRRLVMQIVALTRSHCISILSSVLICT